MSKILKSFGMAALLVALLAGTGMGQDPVTDTTAIAGQLGTWIDVTVPDEITTWALTVGANEYKIDGGEDPDYYPQASIASNKASGSVYLKVHDARTPGTDPVTTAGHMTNNAVPASATDELDAAMKVQANPGTPGTQVTLSGLAQTIYTLTAPGDADVDIGFSQVVGTGDVAGSYYMTVTFTGTITA